MFPPNNAFLNSPLSGLLSQPPRTVAPPEPPPTEQQEPEATPQKTGIMSGLFGQQDPIQEPERLSNDEIKARAEVQTRTYGAVILLFNAVIECVKVSMTLKKGEYAAYLALKQEVAENEKEGIINTHDSSTNAREIWQKGQRFEQTLDDIEAEHELEEAEQKMLFRAIKADLERKNRKNELNDDSVAGTVLKLIITRQISSAFELITMFTRKRAQR